jgi:hypothetical protein
MTVRIRFRRDSAANWISNNPILLGGEIGIETDTLKFKIGNGSRWNDITSYALKPGDANGTATLGPTGKIYVGQMPDQVSINLEVDDAVARHWQNVTTSDLVEGLNLYFTEQRAIDANEAAIAAAIVQASQDATNKADAAEASAIATAAEDAQLKAAQAQTNAISASETYIDAEILDATASIHANTEILISEAIGQEVFNRNEAISTAIAIEESNRDSAINSLTTSDIAEGTNLYFTNQRALDATQSAINAAASFTGKTTTNLPEGTNLYFTNTRAITATNAARTQVLLAALDATDTLRSDVQNTYATIDSLSNYQNTADRNQANGYLGLDSTNHIDASFIPSSIATVSYVNQKEIDANSYTDTAISNLLGSAPGTLDTINEIAAALGEDPNFATTITTELGNKLNITDATSTYETIENVALKAPLDSPAFTGTIDFSLASVSGLNVNSGLPSQIGNNGKYLTTDGSDAYWGELSLDNYLTSQVADLTYLKISDAENEYVQIQSLNNTLGEYVLEADRNQQNGFAGLDSSGLLLQEQIPYTDYSSLPQYVGGRVVSSSFDSTAYVATNGSWVKLATDTAAQTYGYHNPDNATQANKIAFGSSESPSIASPTAGDIYIQI